MAEKMMLTNKKEKKAIASLPTIDAKSKIPKAVCEGNLPIAGMEITCAVLEDGTRLLSRRQILFALGKSKQSGPKGYGNAVMPSYLSAQNIQTYISEDLRNVVGNYIEYQPRKGGRTAYGIKADFLPLVCEVYLKAWGEDALLKSQLSIAKRCQILQSGFARVGIAALIDEATGYQDARAQKALADILNQYLADEIQKWTRTFPLEFYREMYRLHPGWKWEELENGKKPRTPQIVGRYTDNFVYTRLAPGVLKELRRRNPHRSVRHHQLFNPENGHPKLKEHISGVITVMKVSDSWEQLKRNMDKAFPVQWQEGTLFYTPQKTRLTRKKQIPS